VNTPSVPPPNPKRFACGNLRQGNLLEDEPIAKHARKVSPSILIVSLLNTIAQIRKITSIVALISSPSRLAGTTIAMTATQMVAPNRMQIVK
jgi:hypothetical protein